MIEPNMIELMIARTQTAINYLAMEILRNGWATKQKAFQMISNLVHYEHSPNGEIFHLIRERGHDAAKLALNNAFAGVAALMFERHRLVIPKTLQEQ